MATERASLTVLRPANQHAGQDRTEPDQDADGNEQLQRIVEIAAQAIAAAAPLGHQPERQPHQRAERRLHRPQEHGRAREQEQGERRHRCLSISPSRSPPRTAEPRLDAGHAARVALVIIAKKVQQPVQGQHAKLVLERMPGSRRLPAGHPGGNHHVAEMIRVAAGERQDIGCTEFATVSPVQRADTRDLARSRRSLCRERGGATARPRASPAASHVCGRRGVDRQPTPASGPARRRASALRTVPTSIVRRRAVIHPSPSSGPFVNAS